nr:polyadenylate-binding protein RBP45-like [Ipomoea batatas]
MSMNFSDVAYAPNLIIIFVGGLDPNVTEEHLRQVFSPYGELVHIKIVAGKRCGFVQFATRASAEQALSSLQGTQLGEQNIRLSWGRSPSNKQSSEQPKWGGGGGGSYYGYAQGYEAYGYAPPPQDPSMYYGSYPGYTNYQQPHQYVTLKQQIQPTKSYLLFHICSDMLLMINKAGELVYDKLC